MAIAPPAASANVRGATRDTATGHALAALCGDLRRCLGRLERTTTPTVVHATRIAARRLRSGLAVLAPAASRSQVAVRRCERSRRAARALVRTLTETREADVRFVLLQRLLADAAVPPALGRGLLAAAAAERRRARRALAARLDVRSPHLGRLLDPALPARLATHAPDRAVIVRRAAAAARRLRRRLRRCTRAAHRLHRVRLAAKRLRYVEESLAALLTPPPARVVALERLQRRLGDHRDLWTLRHWLRRCLFEDAVLAAHPGRADLLREVRRRLRRARRRALTACARCRNDRDAWTRAHDPHQYGWRGPRHLR